MTLSVIPVGDTREALCLPSIPQTRGRRQADTREGGRGSGGEGDLGRGPFNAHYTTHPHTHITFTIQAFCWPSHSEGFLVSERGGHLRSDLKGSFDCEALYPLLDFGFQEDSEEFWRAAAAVRLKWISCLFFNGEKKQLSQGRLRQTVPPWLTYSSYWPWL